MRVRPTIPRSIGKSNSPLPRRATRRGLARRQYDAVDPDNRLVASELERRWNDRLVEVHRIEEQLAALATAKVSMPTAEERARLMALGTDVEALWHHPGASAETRKHILRTAIVEIVAKIVGDTIRSRGSLAGWGSYSADGTQEPRGS